jgi:hypothetical protein
VAGSAPAEKKGTALTLITCLGFALTIVSLQVFHLVIPVLQGKSFLILLPGPVFGLYHLMKGKRRTQI